MEYLNKKYRIILATAINDLNNELIIKTLQNYSENEIKFVEICNYLAEVPFALENLYNSIKNEFEITEEEVIPVMVLSYTLGGMSNKTLEDITFDIEKWLNQYPDLKIIFIIGQVSLSGNIAIFLNNLARKGVILFTKNKISYSDILNDILEEKTYEDILKDAGIKNTETKIVSNINIETSCSNMPEEQITGKKNIIAVSSIKPGTGKSFVSTNIAIALARYSLNQNGKPFKICLIDVDLQTLSVGTILNITNQGKNLKKCVMKVDEFLKSNKSEIEESILKDSIMECLISYQDLSNLSILCGSQLDLAEVESMSEESFIYIINFLSEKFDYVVVDTNSSLHHTTTQPILELAGKIYYVTNLDFNNIYNNVRYQEDLKEFGFTSKIKYILNQDTPDLYIGPEPKCTAEFVQNKTDIKISFRIQDLTSTVFNNLCFDGNPLVLTDDTFTLQQRIEFLKIAKDICGNIPYLKKLEADYVYYLNSYKKKKNKINIFSNNESAESFKEQKKGFKKIFSRK